MQQLQHQGTRAAALPPFSKLSTFPASVVVNQHEASSRSLDISMHEIGICNKPIFSFILSTGRMNTG